MNFVNHSVGGAEKFHSSWLTWTCRLLESPISYSGMDLCVYKNPKKDIAKKNSHQKLWTFFFWMEILNLEKTSITFPTYDMGVS